MPRFCYLTEPNHSLVRRNFPQIPRNTVRVNEYMDAKTHIPRFLYDILGLLWFYILTHSKPDSTLVSRNNHSILLSTATSISKHGIKSRTSHDSFMLLKRMLTIKHNPHRSLKKVNIIFCFKNNRILSNPRK